MFGAVAALVVAAFCVLDVADAIAKKQFVMYLLLSLNWLAAMGLVPMLFVAVVAVAVADHFVKNSRWLPSHDSYL